MALDLRFPTCQLIFFSLLLVLSCSMLFILSFHLNDFKGHCALFTNGSWREDDGKLDADWACPAYCYYDIGFAVISIFICISQIPRFGTHMWKHSDASFLSTFADVIMSLVMLIGASAVAVIVTWGFKVWCDTIMERFKTCEEGSINSIIEGIDATNFYTYLGTAQYAAWGMWVCWVGLLVCSVLKLTHYHQVENIRGSVTRDRSRLVTG